MLCVQFSLSVCLEPQRTSSCVITALVGASDLYQGQPSPAVEVSLGLNAALNAVSQPIRLSGRAQEMRLKNPGLNSTATCCFNQLRRHRRTNELLQLLALIIVVLFFVLFFSFWK